MLLNEIDGFVRKPVGRKRLFVRAFYAVGGPPFPITRLYPRSIFRVFELLPMTPIEHVSIVLETKISLGIPLRLSISIEMPLACVTGGIAGVTHEMSKRCDRIFNRQIVFWDPGVLWETAGNKRGAGG